MDGKKSAPAQSGDSGYGGDEGLVDFQMPKESTKIALDKLSAYIKREEKKGDGGFAQYSLIPLITSSTRDFAATAANNPKNRYESCIPYDYNRVVLNEEDGDPNTTYINASHVKGYPDGKEEVKYIATQGPKKETIGDFWRMIWQNKVEKIVVLTVLMSEGKVKCDQYWPDDSDYLQSDDGITVRTISEDVYQDYTLRVFELQKRRKTRQVTQFHFTSWPDMGVPDRLTLLKFRNIQSKFKVSVGTPTVVHCSAGVGRTGSFLAIDNLLRQATAEKAIDVFQWVLHLRASRAKCVETKEQYQFIHESVLDGMPLLQAQATYSSVVPGRAKDEGLGDVEMPDKSTRIEIPKLPSYIKKEKRKGENGFSQYNIIPKITSSTQDFAATEVNNPKNRYTSCIPYDYNRVVLEEIGGDKNTTYINASKISGYPDGNLDVNYIATQGPKKETISDFWRMTWQYKVEKIVVLTVLVTHEGKVACDKYWPDGSDYLDCDQGITVRTIAEDIFKDYTLRVFQLQKKGETRHVTQFHFTSWPDMGVPDISALLKFRNQEAKFKVSVGTPTVVHCSAGVGRTGSFLAIDNLLRQATAENAVDVFQWVLHLRACRAKAVETLEQYQFVHESVLEGIDLGARTTDSGVESGLSVHAGDSGFGGEEGLVDFQMPHEPTKIPIPQLAAYINGEKKKGDKGFVQYNSIPKVTKSTLDFAGNEVNLPKNRYTSCLVYDYNRVVLEEIGEDPNTTYINASHIPGYPDGNRDVKYIATQGPKKDTISDFWRMIWQYNVEKIVVLTVLMSEGKVKCEQYWPEGSDYLQCDQRIVVRTVSEEVFQDYTLRVFELQKKGKKRRVTQFHFTSWPDMGVPDRMTLLKFRNQEAKFKVSEGTATVVHCSAGVGRTGSFLVIDNLLRMAAAENAIDVYKWVLHLRACRPKAVETLEQYQFIHESVLDGDSLGERTVDSGLESGRAIRPEDNGFGGDVGLDDFEQPHESTRIPIPQLPLYIKREKKKGKNAFEQFNLIPQITGSTRDFAATEINNPKNRYASCIPYDYNRVVLEEVDGDINTTYINASQVSGYPDGNTEVKYIATQGPKKEILTDFWRMIWQCKVEKIVVLTVLVSEGKVKCDKYWPDGSGSLKCGQGITIRTISEDVFQDYTLRTFELQKEGKKRRVTQFHFTSWPDMGVPDKLTLLKFRNLQAKFKVTDGTPTVVHCSAGVGRTGSFLVIDNLLRMANAENAIDVFQWVLHLRACRAKSVETQEQYRFIHESVLEGIFLGESTSDDGKYVKAGDTISEEGLVDFEKPHESTRIPVPTLSSYIEEEKQKGEDGFAQYELIPIITGSTRDFAATDVNSPKNRYETCIPYDYNRVVLEEMGGDPNTTYINASHVPGYPDGDQEVKYIATQGPKKETIGDFWRMVLQYKVEKIVVLTVLESEGKVKCDKYWPDGSDILNCSSGVTVKTLSEEVFQDYTLREFELCKNGAKRVVTQFHFTAWPDFGVPDKLALLKFRKEENLFKVSDGTPTLVHCSAGVGRTGSFLAIDNLVRQATAENAVDVFQWVLHLRSCRGKAVETKEQYQFVHESVLLGLSIGNLAGDTVLATSGVGDSGFGGDEGIDDLEMPSVSTKIPLSKLPSFIAKEKKNGDTGFSQFDMIPQVTKSTRDFAATELNKPKNRYESCIPYDFNRVVLEEKDGDPNTTYINASHIPGYPDGDDEVKYIATQGPKRETINDFWRMIWQYNVEKIVVLTSLTGEDGKVKCEKYWPDGSDFLHCQDLRVKTINQRVYNNFTIRIFELRKETKRRRVTQFHFTSWPDMGVPDRKALLKFRNRTDRFQTTKDAPIVVHCSAGVGRTGSYLAIDNLLRQAAAEDAIDVFMWVLHLRACRAKSVETKEQYQFVHQSVQDGVTMAQNN